MSEFVDWKKKTQPHRAFQYYIPVGQGHKVVYYIYASIYIYIRVGDAAAAAALVRKCFLMAFSPHRHLHPCSVGWYVGEVKEKKEEKTVQILAANQLFAS